MSRFRQLILIQFLLITSNALVFGSSSGFGQDTSLVNIQSRYFDETVLEELRSAPDYDYSIKRGEGTTLWERIKYWFTNFMNRLLYGEGSSAVIRAIIYGLIIGAMIFSILRFLNASPSTLFNRKAGNNLPYKISDENIHEIDFGREIQTAISNKDFRLATRLYYLQALKFLTDKGLVSWETGKTNADYFYELKNSKLRTSFTTLGHLFEYAWYGGFTISQEVLNKARGLYKDVLDSGSGSGSGSGSKKTEV